jgi:oligopeptide transport system permease protein
MLKFILHRLLQAIPVLLVVISVTFILIRVAPGGPFDSEKAVSPYVLEKLNERYN